MKEARQKKILEIISEQDIDTQNQLIDELRRAGINSTQATISRDIKELRLIKELTSRGSYRYAVPTADGADHSEKLRNILKECVTSCTCAQNIVVIKTLPGLAPAACSAIDKMNIKNLAGTLAGDDTAFIAMRDNESAEQLCEEIGDYF
ncbi:MAG: arginine repressor [Oscillospiraceae bacterium]